MPSHLNLEFPTPDQVLISLNDQPPVSREFASPVTPEDHRDIRWYIEFFPSTPSFDVDDQRVREFEQRLPKIGVNLFNAVFDDATAGALFYQFYNDTKPGRLLTVSATDPQVLALPWELLGLSDGTHLNQAHPKISIRRRFPGDHQVWHGSCRSQAVERSQQPVAIRETARHGHDRRRASRGIGFDRPTEPGGGVEYPDDPDLRARIHSYELAGD